MEAINAPEIGPDRPQDYALIDHHVRDITNKFGEYLTNGNIGARVVQFHGPCDPSPVLSLVEYDTYVPLYAQTADEWSQRFKVQHSSGTWTWVKQGQSEEFRKISHLEEQGFCSAPANHLLRTLEEHAKEARVITAPLTKRTIRRLLTW